MSELTDISNSVAGDEAPRFAGNGAAGLVLSDGVRTTRRPPHLHEIKRGHDAAVNLTRSLIEQAFDARGDRLVKFNRLLDVATDHLFERTQAALKVGFRQCAFDMCERIVMGDAEDMRQLPQNYCGADCFADDYAGFE